MITQHGALSSFLIKSRLVGHEGRRHGGPGEGLAEVPVLGRLMKDDRGDAFVALRHVIILGSCDKQ